MTTATASRRTDSGNISHPTAVLIIASVAAVWGLGFPMTRMVLDDGLSAIAK